MQGEGNALDNFTSIKHQTFRNLSIGAMELNKVGRVALPTLGVATVALILWKWSQSANTKPKAGPTNEDIREMWDAFSESYSRIARLWSLPAIQSMVSAMELNTAESCLEVGCGPGHAIPLLRAELGDRPELISTDFSEQMVALARKKGQAHNALVQFADAQALPSEFDERFDRIFSSLCLHIVPGLFRRCI